MNEELQKKEKKDSKWLIILLVLLLVSVSLTGYAIMKKLNAESVVTPKVDVFSETIKKIDTSAMTQEELQKALNDAVDATKYTIQVPSYVECNNGVLALKATNPTNNVHNSRVDVVIGDEVMYTSNLVRPGEVLTDIVLVDKIPKGEHLAKIVFNVYTDAEDSFIGRVAAEVKMKVN